MTKMKRGPGRGVLKPSWLLGGSLLVTQFAAVASDDLSARQVVRALNDRFEPVAADFATTPIDLPVQAQTLQGDARTLRIHGERVYALAPDGSERPAADGIYRLTGDQVIRVDGGRLLVRPNDQTALPPVWKLLCIKGSFGRACNKDEGPDTVSAVDVREVLASLGE